MVWCYFASHLHLAAFATAHRLQRIGGREMRNVQTCAGELLCQ